MQRTILHSDLNNCYASVESLFHPEYREIPMAVGGETEKRHGIILAKNEHAKKYGVKTAETIAEAKRKCPSLLIVPPRMHVYSQYCDAVAEIYKEYTNRVESFGPDERWLDVTESGLRFGDGNTIAQEIRRRVKNETGLTVSIGVSYNKTYAKIGSDLKKPDAVTVVTRENRTRLIYPLPVGNMLFVGKSTLQKLLSCGIYTIGELAAADDTVIRSLLGKNGEMLKRNAAGLDTSPVLRYDEGMPIKSIGNSTTPLRDMKTPEDIRLIFDALAAQVARRLREHRLQCGGIQIHIRYNTLETAERQRQLQTPTALSAEIASEAARLFAENFNLETPVRSVGIRAIHLSDADAPVQISFMEEFAKNERRKRLETAMEALNKKYGKHTLTPARLLYDNTLMEIRKY
ncbi:MAG: DNA polymerase IV [Clostridia bacterium]|nr:DNA polymerase IV [Clostridia bacterium]